MCDIRTLSTEEWEKYLSALHTVYIVYTMPQEEGVRKYGVHFVRHAHLAGQHDTKKYQCHNADTFLTSHPTMLLRLERALLAIDIGVTCPYWDFLKDSSLGGDWTQSPMYQEDWFGMVANGPEKDYRIQGRFNDVRMIYDPDETQFPQEYYSAYGFLGTGYFKSPYF